MPSGPVTWTTMVPSSSMSTAVLSSVPAGTASLTGAAVADPQRAAAESSAAEAAGDHARVVDRLRVAGTALEPARPAAGVHPGPLVLARVVGADRLAGLVDVPEESIGAGHPELGRDPAVLPDHLRIGEVSGVEPADEPATTGIAAGDDRLLDDAGSQAALDRLTVALAEHPTDDGVNPPANAWIITARV